MSKALCQPQFSGQRAAGRTPDGHSTSPTRRRLTERVVFQCSRASVDSARSLRLARTPTHATATRHRNSSTRTACPRTVCTALTALTCSSHLQLCSHQAARTAPPQRRATSRQLLPRPSHGRSWELVGGHEPPAPPSALSSDHSGARAPITAHPPLPPPAAAAPAAAAAASAAAAAAAAAAACPPAA